MWKKKQNKFPGGIHPTDGYDKAMTMDLPVHEYWPETVTILSEQSFGGKCQLLVKPQDKVEAGQQIGIPEAFMAAPLHASVSGEVLRVEEVNNQGRNILACIIKRGDTSKQDAQEYESKLVDIENFTQEEIIAGIRDGGLTAYLCMEDNKPEAAKVLGKILENTKDIEVKVLPTQYPQGGERQLIQAVLGREVPMGGLPADAGAIVSNVGTAKATAVMLLGKTPLIRRIVTVTGCVKNPGNYLVPIGTSAKELVELCGGVTVKNNRVIAGGPMTGPCVASDWNGESELFYVTKNTSGILVLPDSQYEEQPCIRCAGCESVCPAGLVPYQIEFAYLEEDYDLCESLYASECIACGCCSYICPAKRELSVRTRMARDMVKQRMRERAVKK